MLFVPPSMPTTEAQDEYYFGAIVELDKVVYNWTDGVWISIVAPDANSDPFDIDYIGCGGSIHLIGDKNECSQSLVTITSTHVINNITMYKEKLNWYMLEETGVDTGVFIGHVLLTGFSHDVDGDGRDDPIMNIQSWNNVNENITGDTSGGGPWDGRIKANPGNTITVKFSEKYSGTTNFYEASATVEFWVAELGLQSDVIASKQPVTVTVVDPDMNLGFFNRDQLYVDVYSDSDLGGFQLLLTETEILDDDGTSFIIQNSGIFEGQFSSVSVGGTSGSLAEIFAKPGDTITVLYNECTLPQPFSLGDCIGVAGTAVVGTSIDGTTSSSVKPSEISTKLILDPLPTTISPEYNAQVHSDSGAEITFSGKLQSADEKFNIMYAEIELVFKGITFEGKDHPCYGVNFCKFTVKTDDNGVFKQQLLIPVGKNMSVQAVYDGWTGEDGTAGPSKSQVAIFTVTPGPQTGTPEWYDSAPEPVTAIPSWIKNNAEWWADGVIDDSSFLQGIEYLINEGIIVIPPTTTSGASDSQEVPAWVKKNASWWVDGTIDDSTFVSGIQYLVKAGIIQVG